MNPTRTVRLSMWPDREIEVDAREAADLEAMGLVLPAEPAQSPPPTSATAPTAVAVIPPTTTGG